MGNPSASRLLATWVTTSAYILYNVKKIQKSYSVSALFPDSRLFQHPLRFISSEMLISMLASLPETGIFMMFPLAIGTSMLECVYRSVCFISSCSISSYVKGIKCQFHQHFISSSFVLTGLNVCGARR